MTEPLITHVGQELYLPAWSLSKGAGSIVRIASMGRKWAKLEGWDERYRANIQTGEIEGPGRSWPDLFASEAAYRAHKYEQEQRRRAGELWGDLRRKLGWNAPPGVTESDIRAAASLLKIDLPKESDKP